MLRLLFVTIVLASALAAVSALPMRRKAMEPGVYKGWAPEGWTLLGRTDPNHLITLNIAIKQSNTAQLEALLTRVSDPAHSEYGKHISGSQVHTLIAPTTESISTVVRWLHEHDVADSAMSFSKSKDWVHVTVPIAIAEQLVGEKYYSFMNAETQMTVSRVQGDYTLPEHVAAAVDFIRPTVSFPAVLRKRIKVTKPDDLFVTPTYLRELYNVDEVGQKGTGNIQSFASFLEQYFSYNDLAEFQKLFVNYTAPANVTKIIGPNDPTNPGTEAELDVQYLMAMGAGVETWAFYTAGREPGNSEVEPFLAWLTGMDALEQPPYVASVSYGDDETSVGYTYASRVNVEFQKLGVRGVSILIAAGDSGTGGNCTSNNHFTPDFPSGSPWVTAVGGTTFGTPGRTPTGEVADNISGGGFSNYWPQPAYQADAVKTFFATSTVLPDAAYYNKTGRGYPDVAAQSEMFVVVQDTIPLPGVGGTSCASPTFAGVVALLNDQRLKAGKKPLGFLNPWLYSIGPKVANALNDVESGSNMGCGFGSGFTAIKGWDPVTGWGSPNFGILKNNMA